MSTLASILDDLTQSGELYEALEDGSVRCYACAHRCLIREGKRGICKVRFNQGGELRVPWGYVAALQSDPIEKKPFYHLLPGSNALTFGMLGCDFHCDYCFTGDTVVVSNHGPITLEDAFNSTERHAQQVDGEISFPIELRAVTSSGELRRVNGVFRHQYCGNIISINPFYLPDIQCTPDHRLYATDDISKPPQLLKAQALTKEHYLAVPRKYHFSVPQTIRVDELLESHTVRYNVRWKLTQEEKSLVLDKTAQGTSSREIGAILNKSGSYIRHVRRKLRNNPNPNFCESGYVLENGLLRFPNEHRPGISAKLELTLDMARLLGYFCAEGSIVSYKDRPNSFTLNFSFSHKENYLAEKVQKLLKEIFNVEAKTVARATTLGVSIGKSSLALLFGELAGHRAVNKQVPELLYAAPREVVKAFVDAVVEGDGHRYENGKINITTVSAKLAYGIAWLVLKMGFLPSVYNNQVNEEGVVQGRKVKRAPHQYSVVWYESNKVKRNVVETDEFYLLPIRDITTIDFNGFVYNMEVEEEHNYLANFFLVSNCQNWLTSQAMRDAASDKAGNYIRRITPEGIMTAARQTDVSVVVSSYNEPLITSEWAVAIFKQAKAAGLACAYVSNGNATPEALEYLSPYLNAYKIDLKSMQDKNYRQLGGVRQHVLDSIQRARDLGLWVEVVTLVVPGFNDSNEELWDAARFLAGVSADIPWHVTAFHKDYRMTRPDNTPAKTLLRASEIGREAGLRYVYAGNIPGSVGEYESTFCPNCNKMVIERRGFTIMAYHLTAEGKCPHCGTKIAGLWPKDPTKIQLNSWRFPRLI